MIHIFKISESGWKARAQSFATEAEAIDYLEKIKASAVNLGHEIVDSGELFVRIKRDGEIYSYVAGEE